MQWHYLTIICCPLSAASSLLIHSLDCCFISFELSITVAVPSCLGDLGKCWMSAPSDTTAFIEINLFDLHFGVSRCSACTADLSCLGIEPDQTGAVHLLPVIRFLLFL